MNIKPELPQAIGFLPPVSIEVEPAVVAPVTVEPQRPVARNRSDRFFDEEHYVGVIGQDGDFRVVQNYELEHLVVIRNHYEINVHIPRPWFNPKDPQFIQIKNKLYFFDENGSIFSEDERGLIWHHAEFRVVANEKLFSRQNNNVTMLNKAHDELTAL